MTLYNVDNGYSFHFDNDREFNDDIKKGKLVPAQISVYRHNGHDLLWRFGSYLSAKPDGDLWQRFDAQCQDWYSTVERAGLLP